ncbi:MAG TPA: endonuclease/exonuclease/phosphatase family protein [Actinomycetota bacterium]|jgi:endonuclease/exonuclease/phosphatase family metal-dependent hydrolase|nr:endonuclease/exonuclease/phosphatase family protein [Actinomycetota bacterium]
MRKRRATPLIVALIVAALVATAGGPAAARGKKKGHLVRDLTVMTQNLYLGTDITPILQAAQADPASLPFVAGQAWVDVQATDFPARAEAIADEIAATRPEVVGLQEVSLWRTGAFEVAPPFTPAETVAYDFLDLLLDALEARGLAYEEVVSVENFDGELPALPPGQAPLDVRLTDRDAIIARTDLPAARLSLANAQADNYAAFPAVATPFGPLALLRGWTSVDVKVRGKSLRYVNTHLEVQAFEPYQVAQAAELLAGPASTSLPILLGGDFNSAGPPGPGDTATYGIISAAGFGDVWLDTHPGDVGFTCCQAADLLNPASTLDQRIDVIFHRGGFTATTSDIVGEEPADMTPSGLWPSDHAGVVATVVMDKPGS